MVRSMTAHDVSLPFQTPPFMPQDKVEEITHTKPPTRRVSKPSFITGAHKGKMAWSCDEFVNLIDESERKVSERMEAQRVKQAVLESKYRIHTMTNSIKYQEYKSLLMTALAYIFEGAEHIWGIY